MSGNIEATKSYAKSDFQSENLANIQRLSKLMDSQFRLPGTKIQLGLDTIIGLIPGIGDTIGLGVSSYIVYQGYRLGMRKRHLTRMSGNILIDWSIGTIPLIGDIFDVGWKANVKNVKIIEKHLEQDLLKKGS